MKTIKLPIKPNYKGNYRLSYDGKYITLHGLDGDYPYWYGIGYEEMILVPVVVEARNATPEIKEVTDTKIIITY